MAKVKNVTLEFPASGSPDVVGYKLYIQPVPDPVTYESISVDLGNSTSIVLNEVAGMPTTDGIYNLGVTAVDDAANESSMSLLNEVPLDFTAPDAPGALGLIRE